MAYYYFSELQDLRLNTSFLHVDYLLGNYTYANILRLQKMQTFVNI